MHETYIVAQTRDGVVIVDQHAAHERLVYERMKAALEAGGVARQILLLPEVVELDPAEAERVLARADELARFGLVIEPSAPARCWCARRRPCSARPTSPALVRDIADDLAEGTRRCRWSERLMHVSSTMACHGSVRAGRRLTAGGDERAAAPDGGDAQFRPVQPRPPDLRRTEARRHRAAVRAAVKRGDHAQKAEEHRARGGGGSRIVIRPPFQFPKPSGARTLGLCLLRRPERRASASLRRARASEVSPSLSVWRIEEASGTARSERRAEPGGVAAPDLADAAEPERLDILAQQRAGLGAVSTNSANCAPRDSASMPSAPVPANRSMTRASSTGSP